MKKIKNKTPISPPTIALLVLLAGIFLLLITYVFPNYQTWQEQSQFENKVKSFVGLTREQAKSKAEKEGLRYTEVSVDGKSNLIDGMYDPNRISIVINKGKVTEAYFDNNAKAQ